MEGRGGKQRPCSIRDVAEQAGVAPGTVSRILSRPPDDIRVAAATRRRVVETARKLNYAPNINVRRLFSRRTGIIGLLTPSYHQMGQHIFDDGHLTRMISGLEGELTANDYSILLKVNNDAFMKERGFLRVFRESQVDGLLVWGAYENETAWEELVQSGYPYLFLNNLPTANAAANYVTSDYEDAGFQAASHLLKQGRDRLVWISGKTDISLGRQHEAGVRRAVAAHGLDPSHLTLMPAGDYTKANGVAATRRLLAAGVRFNGLITANQCMADGAAQCLLANGLAVPGAVAVIGCDSLWDDDVYPSVLPRIKINAMRMGEAAARGMLSLIKDPTVRIQEVVPVELADAPPAPGLVIAPPAPGRRARNPNPPPHKEVRQQPKRPS